MMDNIICFIFCLLLSAFTNCAEFTVDLEEPSREQEAIFGIIKTVVKSFASLQYIEAHGLENLVSQLSSRNSGIITFANHQSEYDDLIMWTPLAWGQLDIRSFRWVLAAREQIECSSALSYLAPQLKTILINRKSTIYKDIGLHQAAMFDANYNLGNFKSWVHIFPEGAIFQDYGRFIAKFKPGLAHLIMSCDRELLEELNEDVPEENLRGGRYFYSEPLPTILPIALFGTHNLKPLHQGARIGQQVHVFYGEPIAIDDMLQKLKQDFPFGTEKRLELMRNSLTKYIEIEYLHFYLKCYQEVFGPLEKYYIESNDTGYFKNKIAMDLGEISKNIFIIRTNIGKLSDDEKNSRNYREELNKYLALLKFKEDYLIHIEQELKLTDYDRERISYNLFGVRKDIESVERKLRDWKQKKDADILINISQHNLSKK